MIVRAVQFQGEQLVARVAAIALSVEAISAHGSKAVVLQSLDLPRMDRSYGLDGRVRCRRRSSANRCESAQARPRACP